MDKNSDNNKKTYTITIPSVRVPKIKDKHKNRIKYLIFAVAFILVAILSGFGGAWLETRNSSSIVSGSLSNQKKIVTSDSQLIAEIAKTVGQSVVSINDTISTSGSNTSSGFGFFGLTQTPAQEQAAGTGIIISSNGLIVTNRHVVPVGASNVSVTLSNGVRLKDVSVVGRSNNPSLDIAFLKINKTMGQKLIPAVIGNSSQMQVGDPVVAIGNALGQFQNTVTSGIISGYGRNITASSSSGSGTGMFGSATSGSSENLSDLFQTDAAINEGNSGGPLVNLNGQVIGINTAIAGNAQNIGFAIPINDVKGLIGQVLKSGKFVLPYLGIRYIPLTPDVASQYNLSVQYGAFIAPTNSTTQPSIAQGSPAQKAGLLPNDVVTAVDGIKINEGNSLDSILYQYQPGDTVNLTILRNNKTIHVTVTLGSIPG